MDRVKVKQKFPQITENKLKLLSILSQNGVYATKKFNVQDGFIVLTQIDQDLDKIFGKETKNLLLDDHFTP